jgi:hypothetical protein
MHRSNICYITVWRGNGKIKLDLEKNITQINYCKLIGKINEETLKKYFVNNSNKVAGSSCFSKF